jgi:hypothetical protein
MIVRYDSDGSLILVTQNDHARLSGLMAAHWGNARFAQPRPYESVVRATQYHDLGWLEYEMNPRYDAETGKVTNFLDVPNEPGHLRAFERSHEQLTSIDPYAGLLVTKHRTGVYQARYGVLTKPTPPPVRAHSAALATFIARSEAEQNILLAALDNQEFKVNFNLLQVWDLLSLWICCNEQPKELWVEPVPENYDGGLGTGIKFTPEDSRTIAVQPYPFDEPLLRVGITYRRLVKTRFGDARTFYREFLGASAQIQPIAFYDPTATSYEEVASCSTPADTVGQPNWKS